MAYDRAAPAAAGKGKGLRLSPRRPAAGEGRTGA